MDDGAGGADGLAGVVLGVDRSVCGRRWRFRNGDARAGEAIAERLGIRNVIETAHEGTLFTHFYGVAYPSKPNYLALGGGGTFGQVGSDDPLPPVSGQSVFAQMSAHGVDWSAWAESYPGGPGHCSLVPTAPDYALRHVAPLLFADVARTPLCNRVTAVESG